MRRIAFSSLALFVVAACGGSAPPPTPLTRNVPSPPPASVAPPPATATSITVETRERKGAPLQPKIAQFVPAKLTADVSALPPSERKALEKLILAAKQMDPIFDRQAYAKNPELRARLAADKSPDGVAKLTYFDIMRGPWDRQEGFTPFAVDVPRPKGAGFYPEDLTEAELKQYVAAHPDEKRALESLTTIVVRKDGKLVAVPYSQVYAEWLKPAAELLIEAAGASTNPSLKRFLTSRAAAFASDDYYQSDKDWMDLDSAVEVTIGPYETYADDLLGLKASFEAFVTVSDPAESAKLTKYKKLLPAMEQNLPIPQNVKTSRGRESPIRVVDLVFTSGEARTSVQTIAFNLPNDEKVRAEKGAKKVLLRNLIETKFDLIMRPIAERILAPSQLSYLSADAFFNETLFHELSHSLGPAFTTHDGKKVEVRVALGSSFAAIEECKADVMGAYNILYMVKRHELPADFREKLLVSYFAGLFRSTRFGVTEAHGKGAAVQINRFLEEGGARFDPESKKFVVDFAKLEAAIEHLVHDLCMLQHEGDKEKADAMLAKLGTMSEPMKAAMASLDGIPVDIRPSYPLAGE